MYNVTLTPAYGRDYKSKKAALADIEAGKDFILNSGLVETPCSPLTDCAGQTVKVRYNRLRSVFVFKVPSNE
jgi:hypothetical protein